MRRLTLPMIVLLAVATAPLSACKGSDGATDDTDGGGEEVAVCLSDDGVSPSITSGTIRCELPLQDDQPPFLYIDVTATDPQGDFTLQRFGDHSFKIYLAANDQMTADDPVITCSQDNAGQCTGSISGDQAGVSCDTMGNFYFTATIADDDGNTSPECRLIEQ